MFNFFFFKKKLFQKVYFIIVYYLLIYILSYCEYDLFVSKSHKYQMK